MKQWIIAVLTVVLAMPVWGQSKESDAAYERGMELYARGDYRKALAEFLEVDRLDCLQLDTVVSSRWEYGRQWAAKCHMKLGQVKEARALYPLGYYIEPIDRRLTVESDRHVETAYKRYRANDLPGTIKAAEKALELQSAMFGRDSQENSTLCALISECYQYLGDREHADSYADMMMVDLKLFPDYKRQPIYWVYLPRYSYTKRLCRDNSKEAVDEMYALVDECVGLVDTTSDMYDLQLMALLQERSMLKFLSGRISESVDDQRHVMKLWDRLSHDKKVHNFTFLARYLEFFTVGAQLNTKVSVLPSELLPYCDELQSLAWEEGGITSQLYAQSLIRIASVQMYAGLCREALDTYEKALSASTMCYGTTETPDFIELYTQMSHTAALIGEVSKSGLYGKEALKLVKKFAPGEVATQADIHRAMASNYVTMNEPELALEQAGKALDLLRPISGESPEVLPAALNLYADCLTRVGRADEALVAVKEALLICDTVPGLKTMVVYFDCGISLVNLYNGMKDYEAADSVRSQLLADVDAIGPMAGVMRMQLLINEGSSMIDRRDYDRALKICAELDSTYGKEEWYLVTPVQYIKINALMGVGKLNEAADLADVILQEMIADGKGGTVEYAFSLERLIEPFLRKFDLVRIKSIGREIKEIYERNLGTNSYKYIETLLAMTSLFVESNDLAEADSYYREAQSAIKRYTGTNSVMLQRTFGMVECKVNFYGRRYPEAIEAGERYVAMIESIPDASAYYNFLGEVMQYVASSYMQIGQYRQAADAYQRGYDYFTQSPQMENENRLRRGIILNSISVLMNRMGDFDKARQYQSQAVELMATYQGGETNFDIFQKIAAATLLANEGRVAEGELLLEEASEQFNAMAVDHPGLLYQGGLMSYYLAVMRGEGLDQALDRLWELHQQSKQARWFSEDFHGYVNNAFFEAGQLDRALDVNAFSDKYIQKNFGPNSDKAATIALRYSEIYFRKGDMKKAADYLAKSSEVGRNVLLNGFTTMTQAERANFWKLYSPFYRNYLPNVCHDQGEGVIKNVNRLAYNGTLLSTGILLEAERSLSDMVERRGSDRLKAQYNDFQRTKERRDAITQRIGQVDAATASQLQLTADSLNNAVQSMELRLLDMVKVELGDFTRNLRVEWTDVKRRLKPSDMAIEFVEHQRPDSIAYSALVLTSASQGPQFVPLFMVSKADTGWLGDCYNDGAFARKLWGPLSSVIGTRSNIYFATQGQLCDVAIESLPMEGVLEPCADKRRRFIRLSSTRELALDRAKPKGREAVLYGGLAYDMTADEMRADGDNYPALKRGEMFAPPSMSLDGDSLRKSQGRLYRLPGTLAEVDSIVELLNDPTNELGLIPRPVTGNKGTESSFKALSGQKCRILHIGTHGFYLPGNAPAVNDTPLSRYIRTGVEGDMELTDEEMAMSRSGLFFAGAQNSFDSPQLLSDPGIIDDGILTAREISLLDFSDLDLVVLSACETACGYISGDGVFGLQRGFKKAGAGSILMSLWKVDDRATSILMTEFYRQLSRRVPKEEALEGAKALVRATPGFASPQYWAAFILLDALD